MKTKLQNGVLEIVPSGPVNSHTLADSAASLQEVLAQATGGLDVEIDLLETPQPDSGTIKLLLLAASELEARGAKLRVRVKAGADGLFDTLKINRHVTVLKEEDTQ
jgi:hypothetical protein